MTAAEKAFVNTCCVVVWYGVSPAAEKSESVMFLLRCCELGWDPHAVINRRFKKDN